MQKSIFYPSKPMMGAIITLLLFLMPIERGLGQPNTFPGSGNVGIGTTSPEHKLTVVGHIASANPQNLGATASISWINNIARIRIGGSGEGASNGFVFQGPGNFDLMRLLNNGNVGIGTASPTAKLAVNGNIRAREVKVEAAPWPDYVFEEDYQLPDLSELSSYIKANKHLPGMPSAKEVEAEGVNLGEMNRLLLEKVEELTLLLMNFQKSATEKDETIATVSSRLAALEQKFGTTENRD